MSTPNTAQDGGPAFAFAAGDLVCTGMTLRDYFAAAALPACVTLAYGAAVIDLTSAAPEAYRIADAMLAARAQGGAK